MPESIHDKLWLSLSLLTEHGKKPVNAEFLTLWLIEQKEEAMSRFKENDVPARQEAWLKFANSLSLNRESKPDYKSKMAVTRVMKKLHNREKCGQFLNSKGELVWNCLQLQPRKNNTKGE